MSGLNDAKCHGEKRIRDIIDDKKLEGEHFRLCV